eukprot:TRINITY_DN7648_c0_g1_i1.p1 TRINITY_DN7648_c0_g1~~TRINITY_DN7648_c0_g1_i1.p1  ORF type:complete len:606 (+),score=147.84 TRINITY_DN7648_c0_g1_i1:58-1875(+)
MGRRLIALASTVAAALSAPLDAEVIVAGGGPVGLFATAALRQHGVKAVCFERETVLYHSPRAVVWDSETLRLRRQLSPSMSDWMLEHAESLEPFELRDGTGLRNGAPISSWHWDVFRDTGAEQMSAIRATMAGHGLHSSFHQPSFESRLRQEAGDAAVYGASVTDVQVVGAAGEDEHVVVTYTKDGETRTATARYVVGADGASSTVRKRIGATYGGDTFGDMPWIVLDTEIHDEEYLRSSWTSRYGNMFVADPKRPFVFVRTPAFHQRWRADGVDVRQAVREHIANGTVPVGTGFRFELLLSPDESKEDVVKEASVRRLLADIGVDYDRVRVVRAIVYNFHARRADKWQQGPVFLVGDAAHCMPPFQGQGLNSGLRDAGNLVWKIAGVLKGQLSPDVLMSYETERRSNFEQTIEGTVMLGNIIMLRNPILAKLRDVGLTVGQKLLKLMGHSIDNPPRLLSFIGRPTPTVRRLGAFVDECSSELAGTLIPDPFLRNPHGKEVLLDPLLSSNGWSIVCTVPSAVCGRDSRLTVVTVAEKGSAAPADLRDEDGHWTAWVEEHRAAVVVVRPDKYNYGVYVDMQSALAAYERALDPAEGAQKTSTCAVN